MIKIIAISLGFILSILMISVTSWFENETLKVQAINKEHKREIQKLQKIASINAWLDEVVKPSLEKVPKNLSASDDSLVNFFDLYSNTYNFQVANYLHKDQNSRNLDIRFSISRNAKEELKRLMTLRYQKGFLRFNTFHLGDKEVKGEIEIVQPFYGDLNAS
jgi:hypothetical protein